MLDKLSQKPAEIRLRSQPPPAATERHQLLLEEFSASDVATRGLSPIECVILTNSRAQPVDPPMHRRVYKGELKMRRLHQPFVRSYRLPSLIDRIDPYRLLVAYARLLRQPGAAAGVADVS